MNKEEALNSLIQVAQKVVCCISRQGELGFIAEAALSALDDARDTGLVPSMTIVTSEGIRNKSDDDEYSIIVKFSRSRSDDLPLFAQRAILSSISLEEAAKEQLKGELELATADAGVHLCCAEILSVEGLQIPKI